MAVGTWVRLSVIETNTNSTRMQEATAGGAGGRIREPGVHAPKKAPHVGSHRKPMLAGRDFARVTGYPSVIQYRRELADDPD